ncbi:hypothetical protein K502DRAFT_345784 [Neoconidiobolus thromboides FSU 785]|nr:hypothetical protein K502DRAFT_345784 [Neoconidiobolus thromboides FSU 785]
MMTSDNERKLMRIYDHLEREDYKSALNDMNLLLKKISNHYLLSFKAYILSKLNRREEAIELALKVKNNYPKAISTIQNLSMVLKSAGKGKDILELYEKAYPGQEKDLEFCTRYFEALVKEKDFKSMQSLTIKLHRDFKDRKYWYWAIMCLVLQAEDLKKNNPEAFKKDISYVLAERYIGKSYQEKNIKNFEEFYLYYLVLMGQNKQDLALNWLTNELSETKMIKDQLRFTLLPHLIRMKKYDETIVYCKKFILDNSDDWFYWSHYLTAVENKVKEDQNENFIKEEENYINNILNQHQNSKKAKRGPYLAKIKFWSIIKENIFEIMLNYIDKFGTKSCCYEDLLPYIEGTLDEYKNDWSNYLGNKIQSISINNNKQKDIQNCHLLSNLFKIQKLINSQQIYINGKLDINVEKHYDLIQQLIDFYSKALLLGQDLNTSEKQYGDDFILLASHYLLELYHYEKDSYHLLSIALLLEYAIVKSQFNFHIKIFLINIYILIGVYHRASKLYNTLDIKHVQLDTLSYLIMDNGNNLAHFTETYSHGHSSTSIYFRNRVETSEMLVQAFKHGTYSKVQEFLRFQNRLENSLQKNINEFEILRSEYLSSFFNEKDLIELLNSLPTEFFEWEENDLIDNRDFDVFLNFNLSTIPNISTHSLLKLSKVTNPKLLQYHQFDLYLLKLLLNQKFDSINKIQERIQQYEIMTKQLEENNQLLPIEIHLNLVSKYLLQLLIEVNNNDEDRQNEIISQINQSFDDTYNFILSSLNGFDYGKALINIVHYFEKFALIWSFSKIYKIKNPYQQEKEVVNKLIYKLDSSINNRILTSIMELTNLMEEKVDLLNTNLPIDNVLNSVKQFITTLEGELKLEIGTNLIEHLIVELKLSIKQILHAINFIKSLN